MARRPLLLVAGGAVVVSGLAVAARGTARIPVAPPIVVSQAYREVADYVRPNETLSHLFARHTIGPAELLEIVTAGGAFGLDPRRIRSDLEFSFRYPVGSERPDRVSTRLSADGILLLARDSGTTLISSSSMMRPCLVSTSKIRPGWRRSLTRTFSGGMSSTPTSDAMMTKSSLVT